MKKSRVKFALLSGNGNTWKKRRIKIKKETNINRQCPRLKPNDCQLPRPSCLSFSFSATFKFVFATDKKWEALEMGREIEMGWGWRDGETEIFIEDGGRDMKEYTAY
jgi:hypothetical protein